MEDGLDHRVDKVEDGSEEKTQVLADLMESFLALHPGQASLECQHKEEDGGDAGHRLLLLALRGDHHLEHEADPV